MKGRIRLPGNRHLVGRERPARYGVAYLGMVVGVLSTATTGFTQTDYYNTDAGRPVRVEDAFPVERYAFEAQVAPLLLQRSDDGAYEWEFEPELAYGILPRTHIEFGLPIRYKDAAEDDASMGIGGLDVSLFHNLNVETAGYPAFAVSAKVLLPVGGFAPDATYTSLKGIATRTFSFSRFHLNGEYTFGARPGSDSAPTEVSRWMAGIAVDKTFPINAALLIADVYVEQPLHEEEALVWTVEAGTRYQLNPFFALDAGIGRRMTGDDPGWFLTFGAARVFAVRWLFPVRQQ